MTLEQELDATYAELAQLEQRRLDYIARQNEPNQARAAAGAHGQMIVDSSGELDQIAGEYARISAKRWQLEARLNPPPPIEYAHSEAERARLNALRDEQAAV